MFYHRFLCVLLVSCEYFLSPKFILMIYSHLIFFLSLSLKEIPFTAYMIVFHHFLYILLASRKYFLSVAYFIDSFMFYDALITFQSSLVTFQRGLTNT